MLTEKELKIGGKYLYYSSTKLCHIRVVYEGKRRVPGTDDEDMMVFRDPVTLNEIWTQVFSNIVVDDGWLEKFVNQPEE